MRKVLFLSLLIFIIQCRSSGDQADVLRIAVAGNMQFAIKEICSAFTSEQNIPIEIIIASSGKLYAQIQAGAPYDIFISADMEYPQQLKNKNLASGEVRRYAYGQLAIWSNFPTQMDQLLSNFTKANKIAIANPKFAPYGKAAIQFLNKLVPNGDLNNKLIYGESIAQTNQFIYSKAADIGVTSYSTFFQLNIENNAFLLIDSSYHDKIEQGFVVLKRSKVQSKAELFSNFLISNKAKKILSKFGYLAD
ncbi:MAG: molybdate ABC transporter substrate-binding protein [Bacteroidota bacterium]